MMRILLFFLLVFSVVVSAQQLQSLKIIKIKYDSISKVARKEYLVALEENNQDKINAAGKKISEAKIKRNADYKKAVEEFFSNQHLSESTNLPIDTTKETSQATYSLGIERLYKEVCDFVSKNIDVGSSEYDSAHSKIHFLVQNDDTLFIEKVEGADPNFNKMALLAFLMTEGTWISASQNGRKVKSKFVLPVTLNIE
jgi:hypothetical protein